MGTAYTGTVLTTNPAPLNAGQEFTTLGYYTLAGSVVTADTYTFANMLPNVSVQILEFKVWGQELDTNASPTATLVGGDGTTTNCYLTSKTAGDATGQMQFLGDGTAITGTAPAGKSIVLTVGGTVATAASSGTVFCSVRYRCTQMQ